MRSRSSPQSPSIREGPAPRSRHCKRRSPRAGARTLPPSHSSPRGCEPVPAGFPHSHKKNRKPRYRKTVGIDRILSGARQLVSATMKPCLDVYNLLWMSTRVRSFCKINLGLAVGPARPDGFHALTTLYQTLALHDLVTVTARPAGETSITLTSDHPGVPRTERGNAEKNTAYRIVELALRHLSLTAEVTIDIAKRLPVQGGLGAGSANAAAALIGLEKELNRNPALWPFGPLALTPSSRLALAATVGSDVPLFLLGGSVLGQGRGEEVYPLPDLP